MTSPTRSLFGHRALAFAGALCLGVCIVAGAAARASAGTFEVDACYPYTPTSSGVFQPKPVFGIDTFLNCTGGGLPGETYPATATDGIALWTGPHRVAAGTRAYWYTRAPGGLRIVAVTIPQFEMQSQAVNDGSGWGGGFFWDNGGAQTHDNQFSFGSFMNTSTFGWQIICGWPTCDGSAHGALLQVSAIHLNVQETAGPSITATSPLYFQRGWIRGGGWPLSFQTDDPSGVCHVQAAIGSTVAQGASSGQDRTVYHQCSVTSFSQTVNTTTDPNGPLTIALEAYNAAGNWATPSTTVHVDNSPVALSLSGPTDVPSTAGTQYITARAMAGPSGVSGIHCALDGAASQWYPQSSVQIPVSGVGVHHLTCSAANNAKNALGQLATSAQKSWTLRIGAPTVIGITFSRIADKPRCHRVTVKARVKIACRPRSKREKVTVWRTVRRHGRTIRVKHIAWRRVVLTPHAVQATQLRVPHGRGARVNGWLGTSNGTPLAAQHVTIYTAPDNGLGQFAPEATVRTGADGTWSARLGPGPSRLVEATYTGSATMEPSTSSRVRLIVPAKVELLSVTPQHIPWGATVHIVGRLEGGYLPPGGENVRLRYGIGSSFTTWGVHEHVTGNGRFATTFQFGPGLASVRRRFWFEIAALPTSSYPFAAAHSGRRYVLVGGR